MPSHARRVQRRIKKDIKRKVQAKRQTPNRAEDMIKMMMMMMNKPQQQGTANDLLTQKEIAAKMKQDQERQRIELENTIKQANEAIKLMNEKAKVQKLKKEAGFLQKEKEIQEEAIKADSEIQDVKGTIKTQKLRKNAGATIRKAQYDKDTLDLQLQEQGLTEEQIEQQHIHDKLKHDIDVNNELIKAREKELNLDVLAKRTQEARDELADTTAKLEKLRAITGRSAAVYTDLLTQMKSYIDYLDQNVLHKLSEIEDVQDKQKYLQKIKIDTQLVNARAANNVLTKVLRDLQRQYKQRKEVNDQLDKVKDENDRLEREKTALAHNIDMETYTSRLNPDTKELEYLVVLPNQKQQFWLKSDSIPGDAQFVLRETEKHLADAEVRNKELKATKQKLEKQYERAHSDEMKLDELAHENTKLDAYNAALGKVAAVSHAKEIADLTVKIEDLNDKINDKHCTKADNIKYNRELAQLEQKKQLLEAQNAATPDVKLTPKKFAQHAKLENENADLERQLDVKKQKQELVQNLEDENAQQSFKNTRLTAIVEADDDKEAASKAVTESVRVQQQQRLIDQKGKVKDSERELKMMEQRENAQHAPEIQKTEQKITEAMTQQVQNEEQKKALEQLYNTQQQAKQSKITINVRKQLNKKGFVDNQGIADVEATFAVANDKMNTLINVDKAEQKYINDKNEEFRTKLSQDPAFYSRAKYVMSKYGETLHDGWFGTNLTTREQVDLFNNALDGIYGTYNTETKSWQDGLLETSENIYEPLNRLSDTYDE